MENGEEVSSRSHLDEKASFLSAISAFLKCNESPPSLAGW